MKAAILTNEYPPNIYGGAGIHVDFLTRELKNLCEVSVHCFADFSPRPFGEFEDPKFKKILDPLDINLQWISAMRGIDIVHCHTWYSHFAGTLASRLYQVPLVLTTHSLEPHRPWKAEQLGAGGYAMSCWIERTAYKNADGIIAVSERMKHNVVSLYEVDESRVKVIYNGIDPEFYSPTFDEAILQKYGIDPKRPFVLFVGRITRQKGISQLIQAIPQIDKNAQVVLCAGAPDTPEIAQECKDLIDKAREKRDGIIWIQEMLPHTELRVLYSHSAVFATPSLYEPFGIINLEAMACGTPVVGSNVGGIPEIVVEGETGYLVPLEQVSETDFSPKDPKKFQSDFAEKLNLFLTNPDISKKMGEASRKRAGAVFSWKSIAKQTVDFYGELAGKR
ncbi:MAG: glycogen synthase [Fibromonadaceae bacterium]|jgi:glycogen synthase|nr:glycogen synthase [Fibromonadaceae bacterium]